MVVFLANTRRKVQGWSSGLMTLQGSSDSYIRPKICWGDIVVVTAVFGLLG